MTDISITASRLLLLLRLVVRESTGSSGNRASRVAMALLFFAFTVSSLLPLTLLGRVADDAVRTNVLILVAVTVAVLWLAAQAVFRVPVSWLVDLRPFLPLPLAHGHLYLCRLVLSLSGLWLLPLGPAALWLLATESAGLLDLLLAVATGTSLVLLLGRLAAIIELTLDRAQERFVGLAVLFAFGVAVVHSVIAGYQIAFMDGDLDATLAVFGESRFLSVLGITPPGLFVATLESDGAHAADLARLAVLLVLTAATAAFEQRLLWRKYLNRPPGQARPAAPVTPLAGLLRRGRRLPPAAAMLLTETEAFLRGKNMRWVLVLILVYSTTSGANFVFGAVTVGVLASSLATSQAAYKPVPGCQVWRESLTLPLRPQQLARAASGVAVLMCFVALLVTCVVGLASAGLSSWPVACFALLYFGTVFLSMDTVFSLVRLYWSAPIGGPRDMTSITTSVVASPLLLVFFSLGLEAAMRMDGAGGFTRPVAIGAAVMLALSILAWSLAQARVAHEVRTRAHELLLNEPRH